MNDALVEKIQSRGYWRVNFRPTSRDGTLASVSAARRAVEKATVSLRGWDFPHMPGHAAEGDRTAIMESSFEAFTDWGDKHEFWAIYTSTQFIHLKSIRSDWLAEDDFHGDRSHMYPPNILGLVDNLWHICEAYEFLSRMAEQGLYQTGADVSIGLMNTAGRSLYVDSSTRSELSWKRKTNATNIEHKRSLVPGEVREPRARARETILYILDRFDFQPEAIVLTSIIEELYGLNIGRG